MISPISEINPLPAATAMMLPMIISVRAAVLSEVFGARFICSPSSPRTFPPCRARKRLHSGLWTCACRRARNSPSSACPELGDERDQADGPQAEGEQRRDQNPAADVDIVAFSSFFRRSRQSGTNRSRDRIQNPCSFTCSPFSCPLSRRAHAQSRRSSSFYLSFRPAHRAY